MLQEVLETIHNYFDSSAASGTWTIADGALSPTPALKDGQRFRIIGSDLNDGVYTWHSDGVKDDDDIAGAGLADEVFEGAVRGLAVPPQLVALSAEIREWVGKYGDAVSSPLGHEAFGGYDYTKLTGKNGSPITWQEVFAGRLKRWRKVSFL